MANNVKEWGLWVRAQRKAYAYSQRELAKRSRVDPAYISIIERDGYIPSRVVVERIGSALCQRDEALLLAGFMPPSYTSDARRQAREDSALVTGLSKALRRELVRFSNFSEELQAAGAALLFNLRKSHGLTEK